MKKKYRIPKASVIIANYNNAKYLRNCINSILNQSYKNIEIIAVDDKSEDSSLEVLKKYKKKIKVIKNRKKTSKGSYNQINSYYKGFIKSKGKYIFFLDSDDYFKKKKIELVIKEFENNENLDLIFDLPILKFRDKEIKKKFKQKKFVISSWPRFSPQSCISIKKKLAKEIFKILKLKKFETIWLDFRIAVYYFLKNKQIYIFKKYLTYYRQLNNSASKDYKILNKNWWYRRKQAHEFVSFLNKKLKLKDKMNFDKIMTNIVNLL
jgi:glycosyltransferase involved in cell wall biosynthesis